MNMVHRARARPLVVAALAAVGAVSGASAQSVLFQGYTMGCFGAGCTPTNTASLGGLSFARQADFTATTVNGFVGTAQMGLFTLSTTPFTYTGNTFTLLVTFTDPTNGQQNYFAAALQGTVTSTSGGVFINFDNNIQTWSQNFNTYGVEVNDLSIQRGQSLEVSGNLYATTVPEPASLLLLGSGLLGLGALRRRRKAG